MHPAGWHNDPYGRYQLRYWGGSAWTEHVSTNGVQQVDPLGTSTIVPFAIPQTATDAPATGLGFSAPIASGAAATGGLQPGAAPVATVPSEPFLERLGPDARERPAPLFSSAVAGLGGAVAAAGAMASVSDNGRAAIVVLSLVVIGGALAIRLLVPNQAEARAAAVGAVVIGIPVFATAATSDGDNAGSATAVLAAVLYLAAWALPGFRGRTVLLGLGALTAVGAFASLVQGDESDFGSGGDLDLDFFEPARVLGTGAVYLIGGVLLLVAVWRLDRSGYRGTATGLAAAGLVSSFVGTMLVASEFGNEGGAILVLVAGVLICLVGAHGSRRATTWTGAALGAAGMVGLVAVTLEPSSATAVASTMLLAGGLLIACAVIGRTARASQASHDMNDPDSVVAPPR
jgi:hypothetical protein